jgi:uncharacterized LabA/DUF88 family protein
MKRHKDYTKALMSSRVTVRPWKFSKVSRKFRKKNNTIIEYLYNSKRLKSLEKLLWIHIIPDELFYNTHEEKRTDVNIVLQIFEDAVKDKYDDAIIISWDSDIIPVIKSVKNTVQWKKFISLLPIRWKGKDIKNACDSYLHMKTQHLEDSLFPDHIKYGKETIISPYINKKKDLEN